MRCQSSAGGHSDVISPIESKNKQILLNLENSVKEISFDSKNISNSNNNNNNTPPKSVNKSQPRVKAIKDNHKQSDN